MAIAQNEYHLLDTPCGWCGRIIRWSQLSEGSTPVSAAYTDDLGAVGGACLEDEASALRLDEDSEHPPMILRTD